ncbi:response regulator [Thermosulfuriphilus sp.]
MSEPRVRVVLADDYPLFRRGLSKILEEYPHIVVVGEASNGKAAVSICQDLRPDVLVLDLELPDHDGFAVLKRLKEEGIEVKTVVLSMYVTETYVGRALTLGARGYLSKISEPEEVVRAIETAARGGIYLSPGLFKAVRPSEGIPERPANLPSLTPRELEVLRLVAQGLTSREIGEKLNISSRTVEHHRQSVMKKLGLRRQTDLVRVALSYGLIR